jgi:hypothetical protein
MFRIDVATDASTVEVLPHGGFDSAGGVGRPPTQGSVDLP